MSAKIHDILDRLRSKLNVLCDKYAIVRDERDQAVQQRDELQQKVDRLTAALQSANTEIEFLRISHKIAPTEDDVLRARILMTDLVKKVDKCIAQLRND